jgi:hypothetical protein
MCGGEISRYPSTRWLDRIRQSKADNDQIEKDEVPQDIWFENWEKGKEVRQLSLSPVAAFSATAIFPGQDSALNDLACLRRK